MMRSLEHSYDPEALLLMGQVAFDVVRTQTFYPHPADEQEVRSQIAIRVMAAVAEGERDPQRLLLLALQAVGFDRSVRPD
jgi:hypothetical protein